MDKQNLYDRQAVTEDIVMSSNDAHPHPVSITPRILLLGRYSSVVTCPLCGSCVKTRIEHTTTTRTHIAAALCALVCCCCCIPYCLDSARNTDHFCPACFKYLGTYEK